MKLSDLQFSYSLRVKVLFFKHIEILFLQIDLSDSDGMPVLAQSPRAAASQEPETTLPKPPAAPRTPVPPVAPKVVVVPLPSHLLEATLFGKDRKVICAA